MHGSKDLGIRFRQTIDLIFQILHVRFLLFSMTLLRSAMQFSPSIIRTRSRLWPTLLVTPFASLSSFYRG